MKTAGSITIRWKLGEYIRLSKKAVCFPYKIGSVGPVGPVPPWGIVKFSTARHGVPVLVTAAAVPGPPVVVLPMEIVGRQGGHGEQELQPQRSCSLLG